jgi:predicted outer membrane repeat protein
MLSSHLPQFGNNPLSGELDALSIQGGSHSLNAVSHNTPTLLANSSRTHTFTVTTTNDTGAGSLRQAIASANADSTRNPQASDIITFKLGAGAHSIGLTSAPLDITAKHLTIKGTGANALTVSGSNKVQDFKIESGAHVTISGLTIANGVSTTGGGGILNNGALTLNNSALSNNSANTNFANGGGILNNGTLTANGDRFTNNTALSNAGGAIFNVGTAAITNSSFTGNSAVNGGAIESTGTLSITNSSFTTNTGTGGFGGAIADVGTGKLTVTGSNFTDNSAGGGFGGAILNNNASTLKVTNSSFTNNKAGLGAALFNDNAHGATAEALGLTFSGNVSSASNGTPTNNNDTDGTFVATVDTLHDTNDGNFNAGHLSLRNAITGAISGETITFAPTLAKGTIVLTQGELDINKSLTIQGPGANQLTINANHKSRDFNIGKGINVGISGLNIINGSSTDFGGGISNQGTLTLSNDTISGNTANLGGGGIFNNMGTLTLSNSIISKNSGGNGGGFENVAGNATVTGTNFIANTSPNGLGGGISNSGTLNLSGSNFSQNTSFIGGGGLFDNGTATLASSSFTDNSTGGKGGAILDGAIAGLGSVTATGLTFRNNHATRATGAPGDTVDVSGPVTFQ